jgi:phage terminase Nu1 subunit (DNA packaging protein)
VTARRNKSSPSQALTSSTRDIAEHYDVGMSTVQNWAAWGWIPYERAGRNYRFVLADVIQAMRDRDAQIKAAREAHRRERAAKRSPRKMKAS